MFCLESVKKVSVLEPFYNVERYLRQGLDSVLTQILRKIESFCVNDSSIDSPLSILKEYSSNSSRIKIINQKNLSYVSVMDFAIDSTIGNYIYCIKCRGKNG